MTKTNYEKLEKAVGLAPTQRGLLLHGVLARSNAFAPLQCMRYDWMHSALQDGLMSVEAFVYVAALERKCGVGLDDIARFFKLPWCQPKCKRTKSLRGLANVFKESQASESKLRASCSDMLGVYKVLRHYSELSEHPEVEGEQKSFLAACRCVDTPRHARSQLQHQLSQRVEKPCKPV